MTIKQRGKKWKHLRLFFGFSSRVTQGIQSLGESPLWVAVRDLEAFGVGADMPLPAFPFRGNMGL